MGEETRTREQISQEYAQNAAQAGDRCYRIAQMEVELEDLYYKMSKLNDEAKALVPVQAVPPQEQVASAPEMTA